MQLQLLQNRANDYKVSNLLYIINLLGNFDFIIISGSIYQIDFGAQLS